MTNFLRPKAAGWLHRVVGMAALGLALAASPVRAGIPSDTVTYSASTPLELAGVPVTLTILSGSSHGDGLLVNSTSFTLPSSIIGTFTVRYTGPSAKAFTDGTSTYCTAVSGNNDFAFTSAHVGKTISISASPCPVSSGGGGGSSYHAPYASVLSPNGGETLTAGQTYRVLWSASGTGVTGVRLTLSKDGGSTYPEVIAASLSNSGSYDWTVPSVATTAARLRVETLGASTSDASNESFTIVVPGSSTTDSSSSGTTEPAVPVTTGTPVAPVSGTIGAAIGQSGLTSTESGAPNADPTATGGYLPATAAAGTPSINVDKRLPLATSAQVLCTSGTLIRGSGPSVYYCGRDGKRYVFVNEAVFRSWYDDFSGVVVISDEALAAIPLGGNVSYRPGSRMVKIQSDPRVYAVTRGGVLRWITSEAVAVRLYGPHWNWFIDDVSDAFFVNYRLGEPIY